MAYINLYAVLGTLENLCEIVPEASAMLTNTKPISIGFEVKDGPSATITFKNGRCRMEQGRRQVRRQTAVLFLRKIQRSY